LKAQLETNQKEWIPAELIYWQHQTFDNRNGRFVPAGIYFNDEKLLRKPKFWRSLGRILISFLPPWSAMLVASQHGHIADLERELAGLKAEFRIQREEMDRLLKKFANTFNETNPAPPPDASVGSTKRAWFT
jgi:hypothetical protein